MTRVPLFEGMFCQYNAYVLFMHACYCCFIQNRFLLAFAILYLNPVGVTLLPTCERSYRSYD